MSKSASEEKITIGSHVAMKVQCAMCSKEGIGEEFTTAQDHKNNEIHLCLECKEKTNMAFEQETHKPNLILGVLFGAVGAAIGGAIWYLVTIGSGWEIGYISIGLGYLTGLGVYRGAGKKRGHQLQIIAAILVVVTIVITNKFIFDQLINDYIQANPNEFPGFPVGESVSISFLEPEFWKGMVSPIGLLIYATGIYVAYSYCKPRSIG